jgi:hypothetical protein
MPSTQTARIQAATPNHSRRAAAGWPFADIDVEDRPGRILTQVLGRFHGRLILAGEDAPMTTTTVLILNSVLIVGLLIVLALVMRLAHSAAGSPARPAELELLPAVVASPDLERAA